MKHLLILLSVFTLLSCDFSNENNELKNADEDKWKPETFTLIRTEYNDSTLEHKIILENFINGQIDSNTTKTFNLNSTTGTYFPTDGLIQCNKEESLVYLTCFNGNMHDGVFNWFKIMEYSFITQSFREIANFDWFINYWYYCEINNSIYYYDNSMSLISIDIETKAIDTILQSKLYFTNFTPTIIDNKTLQFITFNNQTGIHEFLIDLNTNDLQRNCLFYAEEISDYRNDSDLKVFGLV